MSWSSLPEQIRTTAMEKLTDRQLAVLEARVNGHSFQRIALSMDLDEATVRGHWNRALRRLKPHVDRKDLAA